MTGQQTRARNTSANHTSSSSASGLLEPTIMDIVATTGVDLHFSLLENFTIQADEQMTFSGSGYGDGATESDGIDTATHSAETTTSFTTSATALPLVFNASHVVITSK